MGKKRSSKPMAKPPPPKVDKIFDCPFCNHSCTVEIKMLHDKQVGFASCRVCTESFSTSISHLDAPIDVYSQWVDECENVN